MQLEQRLGAAGNRTGGSGPRHAGQWDGQSPLGEVQDQIAGDQGTSTQEIGWPCRLVTAGPADLQPGSRSASLAGNVHRVAAAEGALAFDTGEGFGGRGPAGAADSEPGQVLESDGDRLVVATRAGCLAIHQVQPAGKRVLPVREFLRGYPAQVGCVSWCRLNAGSFLALLLGGGNPSRVDFPDPCRIGVSSLATECRGDARRCRISAAGISPSWR